MCRNRLPVYTDNSFFRDEKENSSKKRVPKQVSLTARHQKTIYNPIGKLFEKLKGQIWSPIKQKLEHCWQYGTDDQQSKAGRARKHDYLY